MPFLLSMLMLAKWCDIMMTSSCPYWALPQAQLLLDGEDVVKLLKLRPKDREGVEAAARLHGPVVRQAGIHRIIFFMLFFPFYFVLSLVIAWFSAVSWATSEDWFG